jgi:ABC-type multidrug transport system ATPase subunit
MAASIVESMKNLAKQGKTIICTIHQPSSEIFEVFDKLCLIAEGRLAFIGKLSRANEFFSTMGYQVPSNYNPADFYIKKLSIPPSDRDNAKKVVGAICDGFEKSQIHEELIQQIYKADNAHKSEANGVGDQHASTKFQNNIFGIE